MLYRLLSGSYTACLNDGAVPAAPLSGTELTGLMDQLTLAAVSRTGHEVDYAALAAHLTPARAALYAGLLALDPASLGTRAQRLAFWINLYNVLILDAVLTFQVRKSVVGVTRGLLRFFEKAAYRVGPFRFSANDMEHGVLRQNRRHPYARTAQFGPGDARNRFVVTPMDARMHFALNCASRSCPPIRVYEADRIEQQLELAARSFIDTSTEVEGMPPVLTVSSIFKWYRADFTPAGGAAAFVIRHLGETDVRHRQLAKAAEPIPLRYRAYDWSLNAPV